MYTRTKRSNSNYNRMVRGRLLKKYPEFEEYIKERWGDVGYWKHNFRLEPKQNLADAKFEIIEKEIREMVATKSLSFCSYSEPNDG